MSFIRILIGALIGSLISCGAAIGLIYGGIQVVWWLAIVLGCIGLIIGGFIAGFISRDRLPGLIAGTLTGLVVFGGILLFSWLVIRAKILNWWDTTSDINYVITQLFDFLSIDSTSNLGQYLSAEIQDRFSTYGSDINELVQKYVPLFSLAVGGIFGVGAVILGGLSGAVGGRLNKIDEIIGED